jgi:sialidase-1
VPGAKPALAIGGTDTARGRFGGAAVFDGVDDHVRLPYSKRLPLGKKDFTASVWFRYSAKTGEQPLLWMGGVGSRGPQVTIRALPGENRIAGEIAAVPDGVLVSPLPMARASVAGAHNDGEWHHAVLRRGGGKLSLSVDGLSGEVPDIAGSVSRNSPFGVHLGQKVDSRVRFAGSLDDVRVYDRMLSDAQVAALDKPSAASKRGLVLHLPLDRIQR